VESEFQSDHVFELRTLREMPDNRVSMTHAENILGARLVPGLGLILLFALILAQRIASQEQKSPRSTNGVQRVDTSKVDGKQAFESQCAGCHGLDGRGGERAPDIALNKKTQQRSDDELSQIVRRGLPGTGMPPFASLGGNVKNVVAYLRQLQGNNESARFPGDARKGRELFYGKARCSECHAVTGAGGFIASELSGFGGNRSPDEIRQAIIKPTSTNRLGGKMIVQMRDGKEYDGVVRNEDNFSLQLQSLGGDFQLFQKSELTSFMRLPGSLMPADYATTLNRDELNDLISFLMFAARDAKTEAVAGKKPKDDEEEE
jgi:cytochrome c oxidase cbb3-type subunit 3